MKGTQIERNLFNFSRYAVTYKSTLKHFCLVIYRRNVTRQGFNNCKDCGINSAREMKRDSKMKREKRQKKRGREKGRKNGSEKQENGRRAEDFRGSKNTENAPLFSASTRICARVERTRERTRKRVERSRSVAGERRRK